MSELYFENTSDDKSNKRSEIFSILRSLEFAASATGVPIIDRSVQVDDFADDWGYLYRPGVLFAHGHWKDARLSTETEANLLKEIATGEERFVQGGQSRFQSMCVQLARNLFRLTGLK